MSRKRHVSLQNHDWYFVSDYDIKQCVKTFFQRSVVLIVSAHIRFWGRSQWRNQSEGALALLVRPLRKFNLKTRAFKRVLNLGAAGEKGESGGEGGRADGAKQFDSLKIILNFSKLAKYSNAFKNCEMWLKWC